MCGFVALWDRRAASTEEALHGHTHRMNSTLAHRGPDDHDRWVDARLGVALGHRRLSILDLSAEGRQPMASPSGRFRLTYNGEVYNHAEMREELGGVHWRGRSDTEVLLAGFEAWGVLPTVARSVGMFAFALWDSVEQCMWLARDRAGQKPLYWSHVRGTLLAGSELRALRAHPACPTTIDTRSLASLLQHTVVHHPHTILQDVHQLAPGCLLRIDRDGRTSQHRYWSASHVAANPAIPSPSTEAEAVDRLEAVLDEAVRLRMISDVPLGALLSGGVDSALVVASMQRASSAPVKTFTIGFENPRFDESSAAEAVAAHLGTDHTTLLLEPGALLDVVPRIAGMYDEPFADASQIPTFLVSQLARRSVTVALSGDGGDELYGGYTRYQRTLSQFSKLGRVPLHARVIAAQALRLAGRVDGAHRLLGMGADRLARLPSRMVSQDGDALFASASAIPDPAAMVVDGTPRSPSFDPAWAALPTLEERMMVADTRHYLPDDILTKVDRASMQVSLELRAPLLDHRVIELAFATPPKIRMAGGGKGPMKQLLYRRVPRALVERPKKGFSIPLADWLRGPLRPWAEDLLDPTVMAADGLLHPAPVQRMWRSHQARYADWSPGLWTVLMFQAWRQHRAI
jgi:asparagine synthase (glutamine-hydrolysing)